jgi:acetoin utilization deacetylase AcuC-like enzyme
MRSSAITCWCGSSRHTLGYHRSGAKQDMRGLRTLRRLMRRLSRRACPAPRFWLTYDAGYARALPGVPMDPQRAEKILAALDELGLLAHATLLAARPASARSQLRVHTREYLDRLAEPELLIRAFGVHLSETEAEGVIESQRRMAGGSVLACRLAMEGRGPAINLGGGLHHASAGSALGFCLLNDVAIAIASLRAHGFDERILVVDLDLHDGNGTRTIFARDSSVHTFSIHNEHWANVDAEESTSIALGGEVDDATYLGRLRSSLPPLVERFAPRLVIYVAGSDVAQDDAIGNWRLSDGAVLERDRLVAALTLGAKPARPLAIVLGGGYGPNAWRHPARFLAWLASREELPMPAAADLVLRRFRRLDAALDTALLVEKDDGRAFTLSEEDLAGVYPGPTRQTRFLGLFTHHGVEVLLEGFGLLEQIRSRGYRHLRVELNLTDGAGHTLRVFCNDTRNVELLLELRVRRSRRDVRGFEVLVIEWLLLQHPRAAFTAERPMLPGQQHPGLGLLAEVLGLLTVLCERHGLDGIFFTVSHYHLALQTRRLLRFMDADDEARVEALRAALDGMPLAEATKRVEEGDLVDARTGERVGWEPAALLLPVSPTLKQMLDDPARQETLEAARQRHCYRPYERQAAGAGRDERRAGRRQEPHRSAPQPVSTVRGRR